MWKFLGKTVASMVLTKEARDAAGGLAKNAVRTATQKIQNGAGPADAQGQALVPAQDQAVTAASTRAELIRRAMEVRAAKQTVLAELNEEDRARLVATAMRAFLNESSSKE
jgi:hypothetical protein